MPREKNPRRQALAELRQLKDWVSTMISHWDQSGTILLPPDERTSDNWKRPREKRERRENDAAEWDKLALYMQGIQQKAREIETFALARRYEVHNGKSW